jgi:transposase
MARRLPEQLWKSFEPYLPPVVWCGNGRPPIPNDRCLHAAIYILISGTPWKLMPPGFPCYKTVQKRWKQGMRCDAFRLLWCDCAASYQRQRGINFDQLSIDGAKKPSKKGVSQPDPTRLIAAKAARRSC